MEKLAKFGERLKSLRKSAGLSQQDLAYRLNGYNLKTNRETISHWERGTYDPGFYTVVCLAEIFEVDALYLSGMSDKKHQSEDSMTEDQRWLIEASKDPILARKLRGIWMLMNKMED